MPTWTYSARRVWSGEGGRGANPVSPAVRTVVLWLGVAWLGLVCRAWLGLACLGLAWLLTLPPPKLVSALLVTVLLAFSGQRGAITLIMWASSDTDFQTFLAFIISVHSAGSLCFHAQCDLAGHRLFVVRYRRTNTSRVTAAGCRSPVEGPRDATGEPGGQGGSLFPGRLSQ